MPKDEVKAFIIENPWSMEGEEALKRLDASRDGLSGGEAAARLQAAGPNRLAEKEKEGLLSRMLRQFRDPLIYILLAAAAVTAFLKEWVDTGVILAVVILNGLIGFIQEGKAREALEGIRKMLSPSADVLRDGQWKKEDAAELVPGDVVRLRPGDRVPADLRLLEVNTLRIEESALTGESLPADKDPSPVPPEAGVGDRISMAFSGTLVSAGQGTGVVTATGPRTEIGKISTLVDEIEPIETPLIRQMSRFGRTLSFVIVGLAVLMFLIGRFLHDFALGELFLASIGFAVAAIPESLPAILTVTLALGVQRMARQRAITRQLNAVETLGSVSVICTDKTGTLTKNEMTVRHAVTSRGKYAVTGSGYAPDGEITFRGEPVVLEEAEDLRLFIEVMAVANDAAISEEDGRWKLAGEPTEGALRTFGKKAGFSHDDYPRLGAVPFESERKYMATLNETPRGERRIFLKGAPDRLLDRSESQFSPEGTPEPLDRSFWEEKIEEMSGKGLRVLAAASKGAPSGQEELAPEDLEEGFLFLGLAGIIDPPRPEAVEAIEICRRAGIQVKMITGDHAGTALAIAEEMGIGGEAVTGAELEAAGDEELRKIAEDYAVFARTSPEHKLRLMKALQANGEVVAMTGDGVNDAPALKRADVGVAMGIKGTEASKEAADIVLADDNFATIAAAVKEGRTIFDNLQKAILFLLPSNGAETFVILSSVLFGFSLPLTPVQILWVNIVTDVSLALALAFEPAEPGIMERPPRDP
ncbi:MAG: HAD-IC family P-type ATPase, partial [Synergistaceae bacterium]|nr:HAD-IC family P-type ATPase [Synergistaceae bacterium]